MRATVGAVLTVVLVLGILPAAALADWEENFTYWQEPYSTPKVPSGLFPVIATDGTGDWLTIRNNQTSYPGGVSGTTTGGVPFDYQTVKLQYNSGLGGPAFLVNNSITGAGTYTANVLASAGGSTTFAKASGAVFGFQDNLNYFKMLWSYNYTQGKLISTGPNITAGITIVRNGVPTVLNIGVVHNPYLGDFQSYVESAITWDPATDFVHVDLKYYSDMAKTSVLWEGSFEGTHSLLGNWETGKSGVMSGVSGNILQVDYLGYAAPASALTGDANSDTRVDDDDLSLLLANWTGSGGVIPEPATLLLLSAGIAGVIRRRR